ncbi:MAG TPA: NfeD family protein [Actinopolymorphaceae bacterium]|jgi:membrane protein implicated in regulation of membrane protease activity
MEAWIVWLIIALLLGIAELRSLSLYLAAAAGAGLITTLVAFVGGRLPLQLLAFSATGIALVVFVRPIGLQVLRRAPSIRSGTAALIGKEALVLHQITRHGGRIRIGGEEWTARPYDSSLVIPEGATVEVFAIDGATALVHPREDPLTSG